MKQQWPLQMPRKTLGCRPCIAPDWRPIATRAAGASGVGDTVCALLRIDPGGAQVVDQKGRLPVHYACHNETPSAAAIAALMEHYPESATTKDGSQMLPLHYVCSSKHATAVMVQSVLLHDEETAEEEARLSMLPLHFACKVSSMRAMLWYVPLFFVSPPTPTLCVCVRCPLG